MSAMASALTQALAAKPTEDKPATKRRAMRTGAEALKPAKNGKPAGKPVQATKPAGKGKSKAKPAGVAYALKQGFRPVSGGMLQAYTHAWLSLSGLATGGRIPRAQAVAIAGPTAIGYHVNQTGCMDVDASGMLGLTPAGQSKFSGRGVSADSVSKFVEFMRTGNMDASIGVKEEWQRVAVQAAAK
jgi:hypothetical protein